MEDIKNQEMQGRARRQPTRIPVVVVALSVAWLSLLLGGCGDLLDVENPGSITEGQLDDPLFLDALLHVAEAAGTTSYDNWVRQSAEIGNDMSEPQTLLQLLWADRGEIHQLGPPRIADGLYNAMASQTWVIRDTRRRIQEAVDNPGSHWAIARSYFWDGFIQANRADFFEQLTYDGGPPYSPLQAYDEALELLDSAVTVGMAAGEDDLVTYAYATMARIERSLFFEKGEDLVHLTRAAERAEQALSRQPNFYLEGCCQAPQGNTINGVSGTASGFNPGGVGPIFAEDWFDPVTGEKDPRIANFLTEKVGDGPMGPVYYQTKYDSPNSPIPIARWEEAALIIAEHRWYTGDLDGAVARINMVRSASSLPPFSSEDPEEIRDQIIYERQTEFWLEGRSWQDHRYYGIFPVRWSDLARSLGLNRRLPVSESEEQTNEHF